MSKITIVNGDDGEHTVHVDGRPVNFSFEGLIPDDNIWAVHWNGEDGEIEYREGMPEPIVDFSAFQPIIDKYNEVIDLKDNPPPLPLDQLKQIKKSQINQVASTTIMAGFNSDALGDSHLYPSDRDSQTNLQGIVQVANLNNSNEVYPCADSNNIWERREHTPSQLTKVLTDGKNKLQSILVHAETLKSQAESANSESDLNIIKIDFSNI